jgi:hypothetical protein
MMSAMAKAKSRGKKRLPTAVAPYLCVSCGIQHARVSVRLRSLLRSWCDCDACVAMRLQGHAALCYERVAPATLQDLVSEYEKVFKMLAAVYAALQVSE